MNATLDDAPAAERTSARGRTGLELALASGLLAFGLFVLPAIVFVVGVALLGPYGENQSMGAFYANYFRDLAEPAGRTWIIALGPLLLVSVVRLLWLRRGATAEEPTQDDAMHQTRPPKTREHKRLEPSVSGD